jgi:hypothetical protein
MENPWLELPLNPPYVLPKDRRHIDAFNGALRPNQAEFRLDLSLMPVPFMGNPDAGLVVLARNPKFVPGDLRDQNPDYVATLRANIEGRPGAQAAIGLLERFRDMPAGEYWRPKFKAVLDRVESSDDLARRVLIVELHAYRSEKYRRLRNPLPSQAYGFDLVSAAIRRRATIVVVGAGEWRTAVPELRSYPVVPQGNPYSPILSPGNCGCEGFQQVLAAVGYRASGKGTSPGHASVGWQRDDAVGANRADTRLADAEDDKLIALMNARRATDGKPPLTADQEEMVRENRRTKRG